MEGTIRWPAGTAVPVSSVATTIKCPPGDNLGLAKELSLLQLGDVLVVDARGVSQWYLDGFRLLRHAYDPRGLACRGGSVQAGGGIVSASRKGRIVVPRRSLQDVADAIGRLTRLDDGGDEALRALFDLADEIDFDCSRIEPP